MQAILYSNELKTKWDDFVENSRNGTFLLKRDFMEYHKERFEDASLLIVDKKNNCKGVVPAHFDRENRTIASHCGLTYGGFILNNTATLQLSREILKASAEEWIKLGARQLIYKPSPYIYHNYPTEEIDYWMFRCEAQLIGAAASQTIDLSNPILFSKLRERKLKKSEKANLTFCEGSNEEMDVYWKLLTQTLNQHHGVNPVHSVHEIKRLKSEFSNNITLQIVKNQNKELIAGVLLFDNKKVRHIQYIAANEEARGVGALDWLFNKLIQQSINQGFHYFDFGCSTEKNGFILNEGLAFQKEGFGGRTMLYKTYSVELNNLSAL